MVMPTAPVTLTARPPAAAITAPIITVNLIVATMSTRDRSTGTATGIKDQSTIAGMAGSACSGLMVDGMTGTMRAGQAGMANASMIGSMTVQTGMVTAVSGMATMANGTVTVATGMMATEIGTGATGTGTVTMGIVRSIIRAWFLHAARQTRHPKRVASLPALDRARRDSLGARVRRQQCQTYSSCALVVGSGTISERRCRNGAMR